VEAVIMDFMVDSVVIVEVQVVGVIVVMLVIEAEVVCGLDNNLDHRGQVRLVHMQMLGMSSQRVEACFVGPISCRTAHGAW